MSNFFRTYPLFLPLIIWAIAQGIKIVLRLLDRSFPRYYLWSSGGMPSVHAALVTSVTTVCAYVEGIHSMLFSIAVVFSLVVLYDAMHVRLEAGKHAKILNDLVLSDKKIQPIKEYIGHTFFEVIVGCIVGIVGTVLFLAF